MSASIILGVIVFGIILVSLLLPYVVIRNRVDLHYILSYTQYRPFLVLAKVILFSVQQMYFVLHHHLYTYDYGVYQLMFVYKTVKELKTSYYIRHYQLLFLAVMHL